MLRPALALALVGCQLEFDVKDSATDPTPSDWTPTVTTTGPTSSTPTVGFGDTGDTGEDTGAAEDTGGGPVETVVPGDCAAGDSWRDTLAPLPAPAAVVDPLPAGAGASLATCTGQGLYDTDPVSGEWVTLQQGHVGGRWYFEVEALALGGSAHLGLYAWPSDEWSLLFGAPVWNPAEAVAAYDPGRRAVYGVAADLDAGHVWFYEDGALVHDVDVLLIPGVGAFSPAMVTSAGDRLRFNDGTAAFAYDPPPGFDAWAGGAAGGRCPDDADVPAPAAPVEVRHGPPVPDATTFLTDAATPTELVVLGAYDAGSATNWTWGPAGPVVIGGGHPGAARVEIDRPGAVDLVLSMYEPTDWELVVDPATTLASVSIYAMHPQTVTGVPAGVPVEIHTVCGDGDGGFCTIYTGERFPIAPFQWPYDTGGGDTQGFVDFAEAERCLPLKVFAGGYEVTRWIVH